MIGVPSELQESAAQRAELEVTRCTGELHDCQTQPGATEGRGALAGIAEVSLVVAGGPVDDVAFVAGRAEVQRAVSGDRVDRLRDRPVLERMLVEVQDVVDNDVAVRLEPPGPNVVGDLTLSTRA